MASCLCQATQENLKIREVRPADVVRTSELELEHLPDVSSSEVVASQQKRGMFFKRKG